MERRKDPAFGYESLEDFFHDVAVGVADEVYYEDGDYFCAKCGEPWDAYGVHLALNGKVSDMTKEEAERFMRAEGCPSCNFGRIKRFSFPAEEYADDCGKLFCEGCGKDITNDNFVVCVSKGYTENGEFHVENDICYLCKECYNHANLNEVIP
jgi:hypothetical protein